MTFNFAMQVRIKKLVLSIVSLTLTITGYRPDC
jgi:hypothetical protein